MLVTLLLLAFVGHAFLWVALVNRVHGTAVPHWVCNATMLLGGACTVLIPLVFGFWFARVGIAVVNDEGWFHLPPPVVIYLVGCWVFAPLAIVWWIWRHVLGRPPTVLRTHRTRLLDLLESPVSPGSEDHDHHFLVHLPGNEILQLDVVERALEIPRLPAVLDGLSIIHLSDLHFTGRVGKAYFREVVQASNRFEPDLVAITGDLVDNSQCIDWIPETLGQLTSRHGTYFVLGNHDLRVDAKRLRQTVVDAGLVDLGGRWVKIEINGVSVVLAGNELPWIPPAADLKHAPPRAADGGPVRIVLSHSPDQLEWAQAFDVDLLLAGHLHGGQIRFPLIGPILSPSREGVRYASGTFHDPPTVMHVSRGVSAQIPVRLNCPPEMARLVLHVGARD